MSFEAKAAKHNIGGSYSRCQSLEAFYFDPRIDVTSQPVRVGPSPNPTLLDAEHSRQISVSCKGLHLHAIVGSPRAALRDEYLGGYESGLLSSSLVIEADGIPDFNPQPELQERPEWMPARWARGRRGGQSVAKKRKAKELRK
mmetsp:Transcript_14757/g.29093  ORF Transcript_14757/g.29093 Transcript_14757/m.29093 type:complete len:143 (-) Transcript_14757:195-623(-)